MQYMLVKRLYIGIYIICSCYGLSPVCSNPAFEVCKIKKNINERFSVFPLQLVYIILIVFQERWNFLFKVVLTE